MPARCRFRMVGALCAAAALVLVGAATSTTSLQWHRVNIYDDPPNHERWRCLTDGEWRCLFDNLPEPTLGFFVSGVRAVFTGTDVTGRWQCPSWFPGAVCGSAVRVVAGTAAVVLPRHSGTFTGEAVFLVTASGDLWFYFVDDFVCPWYSTFDEALTSPAECTFHTAG